MDGPPPKFSTTTAQTPVHTARSVSTCCARPTLGGAGAREESSGPHSGPGELPPGDGGGTVGETDTQLFSRRGDKQCGNPAGKVLETLPFSGGNVTQSWMPVTFTHRAHHRHCPPVLRTHRRVSPGKGSRQPRGPCCQCRHTRPRVSGMLTSPPGLLSKPRSPRIACPRSARLSVPAPRLSITQREQVGPASRAEGTEQKEDRSRGVGGGQGERCAGNPVTICAWGPRGAGATWEGLSKWVPVKPRSER